MAQAGTLRLLDLTDQVGVSVLSTRLPSWHLCSKEATLWNTASTLAVRRKMTAVPST